MILAAIDIGSNAARLLICETSVYIDGTVDYTKLLLLRIPLRLGFDVFDNGIVTDVKKQKLIETLKAYKLLMKIYNVEAYKACATSAMRDALNGPQILKQIQDETGFDIRIITGLEEANILYETHIAENLGDTRSYIYIDVGGGSTEVTLYAQNKTIFKESFNIGTIRLLHNKVRRGREGWRRGLRKERVERERAEERRKKNKKTRRFFSLLFKTKKKKNEIIKQALSIVGVLADDADPMVSVMKVDKAPPETYADVGKDFFFLKNCLVFFFFSRSSRKHRKQKLTREKKKISSQLQKTKKKKLKKAASSPRSRRSRRRSSSRSRTRSSTRTSGSSRRRA